MKNNSIYKKALILSIPMMIQSGITNAVGLVDNIMVGRLGTEPFTAVSIVVQLFFVFSLAIFGGLSGPGIYCAQYYGKDDNKGVQDTFRIKWWICCVCLVIGIFIFVFFGENLILLYLKGESGGIGRIYTLLEAKDYLSVMIIGLIPFGIKEIYATQLRETGDSVKPMVAGVVAVIVDVVFNYILIFGKFGAPALGVRGAAMATVLSRFVELLVVLIWAHVRASQHKFLKGVYRTMKVPVATAGPIVKKGLPVFINEFLWAGGLAVLTQCYSVRGLDIVAGLNISNTICNLLNVVFVSLGSAVGILVGQMLGAEDYETAQKSSLKLTWFSVVITFGLTAVLCAISFAFPNAYNTSEEVRHLATYFIIITALFFPVQSMLNSLYFVLRSGGKTVITFLFDSGFSWFVSIPVAFILCNKTGLGILLIYTIIQALDIIKTAVGYILIKRGIWITNLVTNI